MKTFFTFLLLLPAVFCAKAQDSSYEIERLLSLHSGLSTKAVSDSLQNMQSFKMISSKTTGNTTIAAYSIDKSEMLGREAIVYLTFSNGLLSVGYLQATFKRADFYELQDKVTGIRTYLNKNWEKERERKETSANLVSTGYEYSKAKKNFQKISKVNLQYIYTKPGKGEGIYLLRLDWIADTAPENILY